MKELDDCLAKVQEIFNKITNENGQAFSQASKLIADRIEDGKLIYIFGGGGHSNMATEDMFYRSGGLACIRPLFAPGNRMGDNIMLNESEGYAPFIFEKYALQKDDVLLICNAYGTTKMNIDMVLEAKKRQVITIGLTGTEFPKALPSDFPGRHSSGKNLHEEVDLFINTFVPYGDALVKVGDHPAPVGPASTLATSMGLNLLLVAVTKELLDRGTEPPIFENANCIGAMTRNSKYLKEYYDRVPELSAFWTRQERPGKLET